MNNIFTIAPYKYQGQWVFDDPATGLVREALVCGIDTMLDRLSADIKNAQKGIVVLFSRKPFPQSLHLKRLRRDQGGYWYYSDELKQEGWLCPALFKYFKTAPANLHFQVKPRRAS
jgi:hypothetical protein